VIRASGRVRSPRPVAPDAAAPIGEVACDGARGDRQQREMSRDNLHAPRIAVLTGARISGRIVMRHRPDQSKDLDEGAVHRLLAGANRD
jgi:hypothetical protein